MAASTCESDSGDGAGGNEKKMVTKLKTMTTLTTMIKMMIRMTTVTKIMEITTITTTTIKMIIRTTITTKITMEGMRKKMRMVTMKKATKTITTRIKEANSNQPH